MQLPLLGLGFPTRLGLLLGAVAMPDWPAVQSAGHLPQAPSVVLALVPKRWFENPLYLTISHEHVLDITVLRNFVYCERA